MARKLIQLCLASLLFVVSLNSQSSVIELNEFSSEQIRIRYNALIEELRCPKCQNQNLAGSDSTVSEDLRREVLIMLEDGYSDTEIRNFMHERYGDFILYNPPLGGKTLLVWILPAIFVICGFFAIFMVVRSAARNAALIPEDETDLENPALDMSSEDSKESNT